MKKKKINNRMIVFVLCLCSGINITAQYQAGTVYTPNNPVTVIPPVSGSAPQPVFTISLYDSAGTPALQTTASEAGTVRPDVGSLPNGNYTLHIHDGTDSPPLTQQIIIAH